MPKRILVVEDEENIRHTLRYNLVKEGYQVSEARTGPEGLASFRLDRGARTVHVEDEEVRLAPKEFDLLSFLLAHAGRVQSREHLIQQVWGSNFFGDRKTVDVHVRWLREKFERFAALPF